MAQKGGLDEQTIHQIYKLPFNVTSNASLSNFQFKIVHYILPTNSSLCRDNIKDSELCHLCGERQTITHLFVTCPNVQVFWADFEQWWNNKNNDSIKLSKNEILYGVTEKLPLRLGLNLCIIIAKYYIHNAARNDEGYFWEAFEAILNCKLQSETHKTKAQIQS